MLLVALQQAALMTTWTRSRAQSLRKELDAAAARLSAASSWTPGTNNPWLSLRYTATGAPTGLSGPGGTASRPEASAGIAEAQGQAPALAFPLAGGATGTSREARHRRRSISGLYGCGSQNFGSAIGPTGSRLDTPAGVASASLLHTAAATSVGARKPAGLQVSTAVSPRSKASAHSASPSFKVSPSYTPSRRFKVSPSSNVSPCSTIPPHEVMEASQAAANDPGHFLGPWHAIVRQRQQGKWGGGSGWLTCCVVACCDSAGCTEEELQL